MSDTSRIGEVVEGRYRLERLLGAGGFGTVFAARHLEMDTPLALKILHREFNRDSRTVKRFELEARRSASLKHPNTIRVFDYGHTDEGDLFIAMEYLDGRSLKDLLAHEPLLALPRVVHILAQILRALDEAHLLGLVHRDLKPDNVFLLEIGREKDFVKVLDFGISKAVREDAALTTTGTLIGTPVYMSPEQCRGQELDGRSDLYSLGCIAFELLTGRTPFRAHDAFGYAIAHIQEPAPDPRQVAGPERPLPDGLVAWVSRLLEKDPSARFSDAATANEALSEALAGAATWEFQATADPSDLRAVPTLATPVRHPEVGSERRPSERETREAEPARDGGSPRQAKRTRWLWAGLAVVVTATVASAVGLSLRGDPSPDEARGAVADQAATEPEPRLDALLRFFPPSTWYIIGVRPEVLSNSALKAGFGRMTDALRGAGPLARIGVAEVLAGSELFVMGLTTPGDHVPPLGRIVAIDTTEPNRARQPAVDAGARSAFEPFPWLQTPEGYGVVIEPGRVVFASPPAVEPMLAARQAPSGWPDTALARMLHRVAPGAPAFVVMIIPPKLRSELDGEVPGLGRAELLGGRLRLTPRTGIVIHLEFRDIALAREVGAELERKLAELRSPERRVALGVNELGLLASLKVRVEPPLIRLEADTPEEAIVAMLMELAIRESEVDSEPTDGEGIADPEAAAKEGPADEARQPRGGDPLAAPPSVAAPPASADKTASGLASLVIEEGESERRPTADDAVRVHYTGWTTDGRMFDSTIPRGEPMTFELGGVIAGWTEGLQLMRVGEKRRFWIPEELAYRGSPGAPAGMLVFDVELLDVFEKPKTPPDVARVPADAERTASGLAFKVLRAGTGQKRPAPTDMVRFHYTGWTTDGRMFESSVASGEPTTLELDRTFPGWSEGVALMVEGERRRFWIPQELVYKGRPGLPTGMLVFDVELLDIMAPR